MLARVRGKGKGPSRQHSQLCRETGGGGGQLAANCSSKQGFCCCFCRPSGRRCQCHSTVGAVQERQIALAQACFSHNRSVAGEGRSRSQQDSHSDRSDHRSPRQKLQIRGSAASEEGPARVRACQWEASAEPRSQEPISRHGNLLPTNPNPFLPLLPIWLLVAWAPDCGLRGRTHLVAGRQPAVNCGRRGRGRCSAASRRICRGGAPAVDADQERSQTARAACCQAR